MLSCNLVRLFRVGKYYRGVLETSFIAMDRRRPLYATLNRYKGYGRNSFNHRWPRAVYKYIIMLLRFYIAYL